MTNVTNDDEIPEGSWGIFCRLDRCPEERWDSFRTIVDRYGAKVGHRSMISPIRAQRPFEIVSSDEYPYIHPPVSESNDVFCRIVQGLLPAIVVSKNDELFQDPYSTTPTKESLEEYKAVTIINLYSPFARVLKPPAEDTGEKDIPYGIPLVHLLTKHYEHIELVPVGELAALISTTVSSLNSTISYFEKKEAPFLLSQYTFMNIGDKAGASISHLHSQSFINVNEHGQGSKVQSFLVAFEEQRKDNPISCLGCHYANKDIKYDYLGQKLHIEERIIEENESWTALAEYAPERDGHIRIIPKKHVSTLIQLNGHEILLLADILKKVNWGLSCFIKDFGPQLKIYWDRNILLRQQFVGYASPLHMLIDIIPVQIVGGAEVFDDHRVCSILPEKTAKIIREYLKRKDLYSCR